MESPLHDTELLYFISNPYGEFFQFVIARNDGKHKILARILAVGIKDIKTMGVDDLVPCSDLACAAQTTDRRLLYSASSPRDALHTEAEPQIGRAHV